MEFDLRAYTEAAVSGVPLFLVVFGLVWALGKAGLTGRAQFAASLALGTLIGVGYMLAQVRPPSGDWWTVYVYWFGNLFYGLGLGLLASGFWEGGKELIAKTVAGQLGKLFTK